MKFFFMIFVLFNSNITGHKNVLSVSLHTQLNQFYIQCSTDRLYKSQPGSIGWNLKTDQVGSRLTSKMINRTSSDSRVMLCPFQ